MARYNKIFLGPSKKVCAPAREAKSAAAMPAGAVCALTSGAFVPATATTAVEGVKLYVMDAGYCSGYTTDDSVPIGDTLIGLHLVPTCSYAALLATGNNVAAVDTPLTMSATGGQLEIGTPGTDHIVAYADEVYNNASGSAQLIAIRPAVL